jgi:glycosyltransferase involved in cell wall biosynthesis
MSEPKTAMAVLIEPAPYMVQLLEELKAQWCGAVHGWFLHPAITQRWEREEDSVLYGILPTETARAIAKLWSEMRVARPAVVFVAGWRHPIVIAAIIMARLLGARVVSMSDTWTSDSQSFRAVLKRLVLKLMHAFTPGGSQQARYLEAQGVPRTRIFPARMTSDIQAIRAFITAEGPMHRAIRRKEMGSTDVDVVFIFVGRLEPVKGPDLLVDAFFSAQLSENARLLIVGDGMMRNQIAAAAAGDPRILIRGRLEGKALWAEFAAADILVVPSRSEPWGLVINEAMGAGLTVLVHDCCGCIDDLVIDGSTGIVVRTGDATALRHALGDLSRDPDRVAALRLSASKHIATWNTKAWASNIIEAWQATLSGHNLPKVEQDLI